jgi:hypothetical protein
MPHPPPIASAAALTRQPRGSLPQSLSVGLQTHAMVSGMRRDIAWGSWAAVVFLAALGCGARNAQQGGQPATAQLATGASYAAGCRIQGCSYGAFCNDQGFCEERECAKGCPEGTTCNEGLNRCQSPPPPPQKGDRLPQDDKTQNLPTMH